MPVGPDTSRDATPADHVKIDALLRAAFGGPDEAGLVQALRRDGDMIAEVVKPWQGEIAGYYALSRMRGPEGWACLAPVAVKPGWQGGALAPDGSDKGPWRIGSRMMRELADLMVRPRDGWPDTVVVLGDPPFYARAGFSLDRARRLKSPYPIDHTLILRPGDDVPDATLLYPRAFG